MKSAFVVYRTTGLEGVLTGMEHASVLARAAAGTLSVPPDPALADLPEG